MITPPAARGQQRTGTVRKKAAPVKSCGISHEMHICISILSLTLLPHRLPFAERRREEEKDPKTSNRKHSFTKDAPALPFLPREDDVNKKLKKRDQRTAKQERKKNAMQCASCRKQLKRRRKTMGEIRGGNQLWRRGERGRGGEAGTLLAQKVVNT